MASREEGAIYAGEDFIGKTLVLNEGLAQADFIKFIKKNLGNLNNEVLQYLNSYLGNFSGSYYIGNYTERPWSTEYKLNKTHIKGQKNSIEGNILLPDKVSSLGDFIMDRKVFINFLNPFSKDFEKASLQKTSRFFNDYLLTMKD